MTTDGAIDILTTVGGSRSGGSAFARTEATDPGAAEVHSSADRRGTTTWQSWESACACPQLCLRDHERD